MKKFICVIFILLGIGWFYEFANLYYLYNYTDVMFAFRLHEWVLFVEVLIGLIVIYFGFKLCKNKYTIKKTSLIIVGLFVLGGLIEIISVM